MSLVGIDRIYSEEELGQYSLIYSSKENGFRTTRREVFLKSEYENDLLIYTGDLSTIDRMLNLIKSIQITLYNKNIGILFKIGFKQLSDYFEYCNSEFKLVSPELYDFVCMTTNITEPRRLLRNLLSSVKFEVSFIASPVYDLIEDKHKAKYIPLHNNYIKDYTERGGEILDDDLLIFYTVREEYGDIDLKKKLDRKYILMFDGKRFYLDNSE